MIVECFWTWVRNLAIWALDCSVWIVLTLSVSYGQRMVFDNPIPWFYLSMIHPNQTPPDHVHVQTYHFDFLSLLQFFQLQQHLRSDNVVLAVLGEEAFQRIKYVRWNREIYGLVLKERDHRLKFSHKQFEQRWLCVGGFLRVVLVDQIVQNPVPGRKIRLDASRGHDDGWWRGEQTSKQKAKSEQKCSNSRGAKTVLELEDRKTRSFVDGLQNSKEGSRMWSDEGYKNSENANDYVYVWNWNERKIIP